jgi:hypothetical protein
MAAPLKDVGELPGREITDQQEQPIGKIKEIYAIDGDGHPAWVTVEGKFAGGKRTVFAPVARLKDEDGVLRAPYSKNHIGETPEVDGREEVSAKCEQGYATTTASTAVTRS